MRDFLASSTLEKILPADVFVAQQQCKSSVGASTLTKIYAAAAKQRAETMMQVGQNIDCRISKLGLKTAGALLQGLQIMHGLQNAHITPLSEAKAKELLTSMEVCIDLNKKLLEELDQFIEKELFDISSSHQMLEKVIVDSNLTSLEDDEFELSLVKIREVLK